MLSRLQPSVLPYLVKSFRGLMFHAQIPQTKPLNSHYRKPFVPKLFDWNIFVVICTAEPFHFRDVGKVLYTRMRWRRGWKSAMSLSRPACSHFRSPHSLPSIVRDDESPNCRLEYRGQPNPEQLRALQRFRRPMAPSVTFPPSSSLGNDAPSSRPPILTSSNSYGGPILRLSGFASQLVFPFG